MDRPRRSVRQPIREPRRVNSDTVEVPTSPRVKRKASPSEPRSNPIAPEKQRKTLLESSKSDLVSLDLSTIINVHTWDAFSEDSKMHLEALLPPTAFVDFQEFLGSDHPAVANSVTNEDERMDIDDPKPSTSIIKNDTLNSHPQNLNERPQLNLSFFTDPYFLSAARTFQDHLYLNWFTEKHAAKVQQFQEGIVNGTLAAPWKDQVWERQNPPHLPPEPVNGTAAENTMPNSQEILLNGVKRSGAHANGLAGGATEVKLGTLTKNGILRVGDVIAYRRSFVASEAIEKDSIVQAIDPKTHALTLLFSRGTTKNLYADLLKPYPSTSVTTTTSKRGKKPEISKRIPTPELEPEQGQPESLQVTITSPSMLETAILDSDGRLEKARRPNGNAWKCFTVWRWRGGENEEEAYYSPYDERGGRENYGTLFYLRGSYYHES